MVIGGTFCQKSVCHSLIRCLVFETYGVYCLLTMLIVAYWIFLYRSHNFAIALNLFAYFFSVLYINLCLLFSFAFSIVIALPTIVIALPTIAIALPTIVIALPTIVIALPTIAIALQTIVIALQTIVIALPSIAITIVVALSGSLRR